MASKAKKAKKPTKGHKSTKSHAAKPAKPNPSHVPTPWAKLKQLWEAGATYEVMAKATDAHYDANKADPTKPTRAKIWKARNVGVTIDGKLVKFGARGKAKEGVKKGKEQKPRAQKGRASKETKKPGKPNKTGGKQTAKPSSETNPKPEPTSGPDVESAPSA